MLEKLEGPRLEGNTALSSVGLRGEDMALGQASRWQGLRPGLQGLCLTPKPLGLHSAAEPVGILGWDNGHSLHPVYRYLPSTYYGPGLCWRHSSGRDGKINT